MELSGVGSVILGALSHAPRSGYDIKRLVDNSTRFFWAASYGQIYPELRRLERAGLVAGASKPTGDRPRTVYRLTAQGRRALRAWLTAPKGSYELRDEGLLKVFFADVLDADDAVGLVRSVREHREAVLDRLRAVQENLPPGADDFRTEVLEYGIGMHEWVVDWYAGLEERLTTKRRKETAKA